MTLLPLLSIPPPALGCIPADVRVDRAALNKPSTWGIVPSCQIYCSPEGQLSLSHGSRLPQTRGENFPSLPAPEGHQDLALQCFVG